MRAGAGSAEAGGGRGTPHKCCRRRGGKGLAPRTAMVQNEGLRQTSNQARKAMERKCKTKEHLAAKNKDLANALSPFPNHKRNNG